MKQSQPLLPSALQSPTEASAGFRNRAVVFLGRRFDSHFLLEQMSLLKTKRTRCRLSPALQSRLRRNESPYRADVSQSAGNSSDSVPSLSAAASSDVDFPFLEWVISNSAPRKAPLVLQAKPVSPTA